MIPRPPARDALVVRIALEAARGVGILARWAGRAVLATARWCVPSLAAPRRTTASGITLAVVLTLATAEITVPLIVLGIWLTVAWAGCRMTARCCGS